MIGYDPTSVLAAARAGDHDAFQQLTDPYRYELRVHCYRIVGSLQDAEDLVQETFLRAWRRLETYEGRASIRAWLYKIATNACLDAVEKQKRGLPPAFYPASGTDETFSLADTEPTWLNPCPDDWFNQIAVSPEARYTARESMSLAFLVALQLLPARQRAILILRDVLDWQASEVAELLEITVSAVTSALHRARVTLKQHAPQTSSTELLKNSPSNDKLHAALDRYVRAWEAEDISMLVSLLKEDAVMSMPPSTTWFRGREAIRAFVADYIFPVMGAVRWRFRPVLANGQPAFAVYEPDKSGKRYQAHSIHVLNFDGPEVAEMTVFYLPELFAFFGLPAQFEME